MKQTLVMNNMHELKKLLTRIRSHIKNVIKSDPEVVKYITNMVNESLDLIYEISPKTTTLINRDQGPLVVIDDEIDAVDLLRMNGFEVFHYTSEHDFMPDLSKYPKSTIFLVDWFLRRGVISLEFILKLKNLGFNDVMVITTPAIDLSEWNIPVIDKSKLFQSD